MRIAPVLMALALAGGIAWWVGLVPGPAVEETAAAPAPAGQAAAPRVAAVPVLVHQSVAELHEVTLILRGRTEAARRVDLAAQLVGQVISEPLRRGTQVREGQILCALDPGIHPARLAEAEASLAEAQAEANVATRLKNKGFAAETTLNTRLAQLEAAQARLDQVRWDIRNLEIRAPFDGLLESDTAELGALMTQASTCATVIDLSQIKVAAYVAERDVDLLAVGQPAAARLINGAVADGEITFISRAADEQTRTYAVDATLSNADGRIRHGMTAELAIALPARTAHLIPQTALTLDDTGLLGVRLAEDGIARFRPVALIGEVREGVWVTGLPGRIDLIVSGQEFVRDGRAILATVAEPSG